GVLLRRPVDDDRRAGGQDAVVVAQHAALDGVRGAVDALEENDRGHEVGIRRERRELADPRGRRQGGADRRRVEDDGGCRGARGGGGGGDAAAAARSRGARRTGWARHPTRSLLSRWAGCTRRARCPGGAAHSLARGAHGTSGADGTGGAGGPCWAWSSGLSVASWRTRRPRFAGRAGGPRGSGGPRLAGPPPPRRPGRAWLSGRSGGTRRTGFSEGAQRPLVPLALVAQDHEPVLLLTQGRPLCRRRRCEERARHQRDRAGNQRHRSGGHEMTAP